MTQIITNGTLYILMDIHIDLFTVNRMRTKTKYSNRIFARRSAASDIPARLLVAQEGRIVARAVGQRTRGALARDVTLRRKGLQRRSVVIIVI